jgi:two-component system, OmpR family, sensor histidine kinase VicK
MASTEELVFKRMIDQSLESFLIYNIAEARFIYANSSFESITSSACEQLLSDPAALIETIHPEDQQLARKIFNRLLRKTSSTLLDFRIVRADESVRWIKLRVYPLFDGTKIEYLIGILEDDTARKAAIFNMEKVNGWKDSLLEILAHDLRGPIGIIKMLASAIDQQLQVGGNKKIRQWTKMIEEISMRNIRLIHDMIKRESLDTEGVEISLERVDLVWEIGHLMQIYISSETETLKKFRFTHSHEKIFAQVDSMKLMQVINNLISNAIKFTGEQGHINVHLEKLERTVLVTVSDNGIGIPRSMLPMLFNKYTAAGRTGLDGQESVGLGMWIVKTFTEAHHGRVWVESEESRGSTIYVEIPLGELEELIEKD